MAFTLPLGIMEGVTMGQVCIHGSGVQIRNGDGSADWADGPCFTCIGESPSGATRPDSIFGNQGIRANAICNGTIMTETSRLANQAAPQLRDD